MYIAIMYPGFNILYILYGFFQRILTWIGKWDEVNMLDEMGMDSLYLTKTKKNVNRFILRWHIIC